MPSQSLKPRPPSRSGLSFRCRHLQQLIRIIDDLIPIPPRRCHRHPLIDPAIPLIARLHRQLQAHPILVCSDALVLPQLLQYFLLPGPCACGLQVYRRPIMREEIVPRVQVGCLLVSIVVTHDLPLTSAWQDRPPERLNRERRLRTRDGWVIEGRPTGLCV